MSSNRRLKVCLAASSGGHLNQLMRLEGAWRDYEAFFVTTGSMVADELRQRYGARVWVVGESNHRHPFKVLSVLMRCVGIVFKERPDIVISTGAAHGGIMCALGKLAGARVVWIDSIANVERPSLSGRIVSRFADLFIVQWPDIAGRRWKAEYHGQLV